MKNINCFASKRGVLSAFTLAEMMVVMLILSIVLAAMAPVMTTRNKPNNSSPWQYEGSLRQNAWFGAGASQKAMIGQRETKTGDIATKLQITLGSGDTTTSLLAFKRGDTQLGRLYMSSDQLLLGNLSSGNLGSGAVVIGRNLQAGTNSTGLGSTVVATGNNSTAVGSTVTASGANSIAIGTSTTASGSNSIGIGNSATATTQATAFGSGAEAKSNNSVAIGYLAKVPENSTSAIAIGSSTTATANYAIAIGQEANATKAGNIAIGVRSDATGQNSIALGGIAGADNTIAIGTSNAVATNTVAIGNNTNAKEEDSIAIGRGALADARYNIIPVTSPSIAIGPATTAANGSIALGLNYYNTQTRAVAPSSIAIGRGAVTTNVASIAIGSNVSVTGHNSVAIGDNFSNTNDNVIQLGNASTTVYIPGNLVAKGTILLGGENNDTFIYTNNNDDGRKGYNVMYRADEGTNHNRWQSLSHRGTNNITVGGQIYTVVNSDRRLKYVGKENTSGLDKIRQLKIFNYTYKKDTTKTPHVGVIAQDLQKVFPNAVKKGADGFLTIRMEDMFYAVINAIKELDAKYQAQEKRINELEKRIEVLEAKTK